MGLGQSADGVRQNEPMTTHLARNADSEHFHILFLGLVRLRYRVGSLARRLAVRDEDRNLGDVWSCCTEQLRPRHAETLHTDSAPLYLAVPINVNFTQQSVLSKIFSRATPR